MRRLLFFSLLLAITACQWMDPKLEPVATVEEGPGNIAVTPDGRIFISNHSLYSPQQKLVELLSDGSTVPFPNAQWSIGSGEGDRLRSVLGVQADRQGRLWLLDGSRIVVWDLNSNSLARIIKLGDDARARGSFFNDLAIDEKNQAVYISDSSRLNPAIVVINLTSGAQYRVLQNHHTTKAKLVSMQVNDPVVPATERPTRASIGVDGITIDPQYQWVYFTPAQGEYLWRIATSDLLDQSLTDQQRGEKVIKVGARPACDGITIDNQGNVYITDITNNAIGVVTKSGEYRLLVQDPQQLSWPDSIAMGDDGYIYVVSNQLHRSAIFNRGQDLTRRPFSITRVKALAKGTAGR